MLWDACVSSCKGILGVTTSHGVSVLQKQRCTHHAELGTISVVNYYSPLLTLTENPCLMTCWHLHRKRILGKSSFSHPFSESGMLKIIGKSRPLLTVTKNLKRIFSEPFLFTFRQAHNLKGMLVQAILFWWSYCVTLLFWLSASHVSEAVPYTEEARAVHLCGIWAALFALTLFKTVYFFLEYSSDLRKIPTIFQRLQQGVCTEIFLFSVTLVSIWKCYLKLKNPKPWKHTLNPETHITNWKENVFFVILLLIAKLVY